MPNEKEIEEQISGIATATVNSAVGKEKWLYKLSQAYLSMKSERDGLLSVIEERSKRWEHEEDSYALDASRLAIKLSETESERDKYKEIVEKDTEAIKPLAVYYRRLIDGRRGYPTSGALWSLDCGEPTEATITIENMKAIDSALSLRDKNEE